jgi:hypothetical protein
MFPTPDVDGFSVSPQHFLYAEGHMPIALGRAISDFSIQEGLDEELIRIPGG